MMPLSEADKELSVEGWLRQQVAAACVEMEEEGMRRIERLRREMTNSRSEIEAILRGQSGSKRAPPLGMDLSAPVAIGQKS